MTYQSIIIVEPNVIANTFSNVETETRVYRNSQTGRQISPVRFVKRTQNILALECLTDHWNVSKTKMLG
jgi:hypothetical protein